MSIFKSYGVDAITLQAKKTRRNGHREAADLLGIVRLAEGGLRSLNNILEVGLWRG